MVGIPLLPLPADTDSAVTKDMVSISEDHAVVRDQHQAGLEKAPPVSGRSAGVLQLYDFRNETPRGTLTEVSARPHRLATEPLLLRFFTVGVGPRGVLGWWWWWG